MSTVLCFVLCALGVLSACGSSPDDPCATGACRADVGAAEDAAVGVDASLPDATVRDASLPDAGSDAQMDTSVVDAGGPDTAPTCPPPILDGNEDRTIKLINPPGPGGIGSPRNPAMYDGTYDDIAVGSGWPGGGSQSFFNLTADKYIAMEFQTDASDVSAFFAFVPPGNGQGAPSTATTVAISECPGDFGVHLGQARCLSIGGGAPSLRWSQDATRSPAGYCILEKNHTYYLNIVHSNATVTGYTPTGCTSTACGGIFSQAVVR